MIRKRFIMSIIFPLLLSVSVHAQTPTIDPDLGLDFIWPTDASFELTSSFGEYRSTHFHYGIDIKTWNRTGYKVFATEDGYVSRIRVSPFGYGKAIYITHKGGYITVYGHLDRFEGNIADYILNYHYRKKTNEINVYLKPGEIKVRKGEVIAYTGETGVGTPHLHYEIRDPYENELNPMLIEPGNFKDQTPPTLSGIRLLPAELTDRVNGSFLPFDVELDNKTPIPVVGTVGVLISGHDRSDGGFNRLGFQTIILTINGQQWYKSEKTHFPISQARLVRSEFNWKMNKTGQGRWIQCFSTTDKNPGIFEYNPLNNGWINGLPDGLYTVEVRVFDVMGNQTSAEFTIDYLASNDSKSITMNMDPSPNRKTVNLYGNTPSTVEQVTEWNYNQPVHFSVLKEGNGQPALTTITDIFISEPHLLVSVSVPENNRSSVLLAANEFGTPLNMVRMEKEDKEIYAMFSLSGFNPFRSVSIQMLNENNQIQSKTYLFSKVKAGHQSQLYRSNGVVFSISDETLLYDEWVFTSETGSLNRPEGWSIEFGPEYTPVYRNYSLSVQLPDFIDNPEKWAIYSVKNETSFGFEGNRLSGRELSARLSNFGQFTIKEDVQSPEIELVYPVTNKQKEQYTRVILKLSDDLSGIRTSSIIATVNGEWTLAEYDSEGNQCHVILPPQFHSQPLSVQFKVQDQSGNSSSKQFNIP